MTPPVRGKLNGPAKLMKIASNHEVDLPTSGQVQESATGHPDMSETQERQDHRHMICCVLALEIAGYDAMPVFDQIRVMQNFRRLLSDVTATAGSDFVSILREDGALLSFIADPERCFRTALAIRAASLTQDGYGDLPVRIGVSHGTVHIAKDESGHPHMGGEARQDADRVMRHRLPRHISVTRSFFELLSGAAPELARMLEFQGVFTDTVGPALGLYGLAPPPTTGSEPTERSSRAVDVLLPPNPGAPAVPVESMVKRHRRSWLGYALLAMGVVGVAGVLSIRMQHDGTIAFRSSVQPTTSTAARETELSPAQAQKIARAVGHGRSGPSINQATPVEAPKPSEHSASLYLAVKPWGEVYVDGRRIGVTPPLKSFQLEPGHRLITIKNSSLPDYQAQLTVQPEAKITIAHNFECIPDREKPCRNEQSMRFERRSSASSDTAETGPRPEKPSEQQVWR